MVFWTSERGLSPACFSQASTTPAMWLKSPTLASGGVFDQNEAQVLGFLFAGLRRTSGRPAQEGKVLYHCSGEMWLLLATSSNAWLLRDQSGAVAEFLSS